MARYLFTFSFQGSAKLLTDKNNDLEEPPFVSVYSTTYQKAVKKVLKMQLPNVESDGDLLFMSCQEDALDDEIFESAQA
jgi:hypothetical protein